MAYHNQTRKSVIWSVNIFNFSKPWQKPRRKYWVHLCSHLKLFAQIICEWITICSKSITYFQNFTLCSLSRIKYNKYIFINLQKDSIWLISLVLSIQGIIHTTYQMYNNPPNCWEQSGLFFKFHSMHKYLKFKILVSTFSADKGSRTGVSTGTCFRNTFPLVARNNILSNAIDFSLGTRPLMNPKLTCFDWSVCNSYTM